MERAEKVATEFLQEKCQLGPLMFIPGKVLHIEEGKESDGTPSRYQRYHLPLHLTLVCVCVVVQVVWSGSAGPAMLWYTLWKREGG